jgi:hypothetical protein
MLRDIELDDREVEAFLQAAVAPREELVYRLALRDLCPRLRNDWHFRQRLHDLMIGVQHSEISSVLAEAADIEDAFRR